ncbi:MAG TPA: DUF2252 family protein [Steroidobacteraceae bacterium]|jgi:uncharacterized protein (DUF2252 family)
MTGLVSRIVQANEGRLPLLLRRKYDEMAQDAFAFYRGTAHLFFGDLEPSRLPKSPVTWCSGDLHLENFGTFKGDNGLAYFDVNDFDEACLLPISWDLARFATSVWVAGPALKLNAIARRTAVRTFLTEYQHQLAEGKARWLERATAEGPVRELLRQLRNRTSAMLLEKRTIRKRTGLRIRDDGRYALPISKAQRKAAFQLVSECRHPQPAFEPVDAARRIAGLGSLGLDRYVVLVRHKDDTRRYEVLDVKESRPSAAAVHRARTQPRWPSEAARVIEVQRRSQAAAPAFLSVGVLDGKSYVIRQLQPLEDRLDLQDIVGRQKAFRCVLESMARVVAWDHLRSAGRQGASPVDDLIEFGQSEPWISGLASYAERYGKQVEKDHKKFARALKARKVPIPADKPERAAAAPAD